MITAQGGQSLQPVPRAQLRDLLVPVLRADSPSLRGQLPSFGCVSGRAQRRRPDTSGAGFGGPGLGQQFEGCSARAYKPSGLSGVGDHRGDVDDRAPSAFGHGWRQGRDEEERHLDVQCKVLVELCFGGSLRWSENATPALLMRMST